MKLPALSLAIVLLAGPAVAVADELEDAVQSLKDAAAKKDVDAIKKLTATIRPMTAEIVAKPRPRTPRKRRHGKSAWLTRKTPRRTSMA